MWKKVTMCSDYQVTPLVKVTMLQGDKMTNWHDRKVRYWQGYMITRLIGDKVSQPSKNNKSSKKAKNVITKIYFLIAVL